MKKVLLAYSGGLDTTYCALYLKHECQYEVHLISVDTGSLSISEKEHLAIMADKLGAASFVCKDVSLEYYETCIRYLIYGNVLKHGTYPLSVSAERAVQAITIAQYAKELGIDTVAHGSTGAGNDQVRFDMIIRQINPDISIITPIRDKQLSRAEEIAYIREYGIDFPEEKAIYSINKGLWGTSIGGKETLGSKEYLPEHAWPTPITAEESIDIMLTFLQGELIDINSQSLNDPLKCIRELEAIVQPYGIGRDIHVGDTIIGIKGRVGFEAGTPIIIIKAHHLLEKHVLTKWQLHWKDQLSGWYGTWLHEGHMLDPVMRDIESFFISTQKYVSGTVFIRLYPYRFELLGIESQFDLMSNAFGSYGEMNRTWSGDDVKGFATIFGNQTLIHRTIHGGVNDA
jgi:argininosuccinate synthase